MSTNEMAALQIALLLCVQIVAVISYSCKYSDYDLFTNSYKTKYRYCSDINGYCCGSNCCYYYYLDYYELSAGGIAGIVTGSLIGIGLLISLIIAIVCCCRKQQNYVGRTFTNGTTAGVTVVQTGNPAYPMQQNIPIVQPPAYPGTGVSTTPPAYPGTGVSTTPPTAYPQQENYGYGNPYGTKGSAP